MDPFGCLRGFYSLQTALEVRSDLKFEYAAPVTLTHLSRMHFSSAVEALTAHGNSQMAVSTHRTLNRARSANTANSGAAADSIACAQLSPDQRLETDVT